MDGDSLERVLRADPHASKFFVGVFAADTLPHPLPRKPALLIANTDPRYRPGQHWVAIYVDAKGRGEYFDSYGLPPFVTWHRLFMRKACKSWKYNHVDLQALNSTVCGQYCVVYLLFKAHGYTLSNFLARFTQNCDKNDVFVDQLFQRYAKKTNLCTDIRLKTTQMSCKRRVKKRL